MSALDPVRLGVVLGWSLEGGAHDPVPTDDEMAARDAEACVMEAVSFVAGEPWSDHPECACPVIGEFMRSWNDGLPDNASRDRLLKPLIPRLVGSKSTKAIEAKRSWLALDWLVRVHCPAWLELAGLKDHAATVRALAELHGSASSKAAVPALRAASAAVGDARDAARDAAWAAARDAAWAAARAAARAAAWDAAWDAAGDAAGAAAGDAARDAAGDAAGAAARAAARAKIRPTVEQLQASALDLIDRMLALSEGTP